MNLLFSRKVSSENEAERSRPDNILVIAKTLLWAIIAVFAIEVIRELISPGGQGWVSHMVTIFIGGLSAAAAAHFISYNKWDNDSGIADAVAKARRASEELLRVKGSLEEQIGARTDELNRLNAALRFDILQRQKAEAALRESESRFRELADLLPLTVFECDANGVITFFNRKALEVFSYLEADSDSSHTIMEMVIEEDRQRAAENLRQTLRGQRKPGGCEYRAMRKDGTAFEIMVESSPVIREGTVTGLRGVVVDITEHKRIEDQQREYLQFLQRLLDTLPNPVFYKDRELRYRLCNSAFAEAMGKPREEIIGKRLTDLLTAESVDVFHELDLRLLEESGSLSHEQVIQLGDEPERHLVTHRATYVGPDGSPMGIIGVFTDITATKAAAAELTRSNETLRRVVEMAPLPIMSIDLDGKVGNVWNPAAEQMFGWPATKAQGHFLPIIHESDLDKFHKFTALLHQGRSINAVEVNPVRWDGATVPCDLFATPIHDAEGEVSGAIIMHVDRTESKRVEEALRESEERFRNMADSAPVLMWMAGADRHCYYFNKMWLAFTGRGLQKEYGKGWLEGVHPEDRETILSVYRTAFQTRQPYVTEFRLLHSDGTYHWLLDRGSPRIASDGNFTGFIGTCTDITDIRSAEHALRESEQRFRAIFDTAQDWVYIKDANLVYSHVNPVMTKMMGIPAARLIGSNDESLFGPEIAEQIREEDFHVLAGEIVETESIRLIQGVQTIFHVVKVPLRDPHGKIIGVCGIARDVTERKHTEEKVQRSLSLLKATIESTADGILVVDRQGRVTAFNRRFLDLWNIPMALAESRDDEKLLAHALDQLQNPAAFISRVRELYDHPGNESFDTLAFADGRVFERFSSPQYVGNEPVGRVWSFRDVTERHMAEQETIHWMKAYEALVTSSGGVVYDYDVTTGEIHWGGSAQQTLGYTPEHAESDICDWESRIHPDDRAAAIEKLEAAQNALSAYDVEYRYRHHDGYYVWMHDHGMFVADKNRRPVRMLGMMQDVSDHHGVTGNLQIGEKKLRMMNQSPDEMVWAASHDLRFIYMNQAVEDMLGFTTESALQFHLNDVLTSHSAAKAQALISDIRWQVAQGTVTDDSTWSSRLEHIRSDGTTVWANVSLSVVLGEEGEIWQFLGVVHTQGRAEDGGQATHRNGQRIRRNGKWPVPRHDLEALYHELRDTLDTLTSRDANNSAS